jgi:hypothetical protein
MHHIAAVRRSCFFQLGQLRAVRRSLTIETTKVLIHAFVSGRLDYCNSLLAGVASDLIRQLQSVQNAAARLVTGLLKFDHITQALRAARPEAYRLQGDTFRFQVPARTRPIIFG